MPDFTKFTDDQLRYDLNHYRTCLHFYRGREAHEVVEKRIAIEAEMKRRGISEDSR